MVIDGDRDGEPGVHPSGIFVSIVAVDLIARELDVGGEEGHRTYFVSFRRNGTLGR